MGEELSVKQEPQHRGQDLCYREGHPEPVQTEAGKEETERYEQDHSSEECQQRTFQPEAYRLEKDRKD